MWDIELLGGPSDGHLFGLPETPLGRPPTELRTMVQPGPVIADLSEKSSPKTKSVPVAVYILNKQQGKKWWYKYRGQLSAES